jgi:hypothetical protein
MMNDNDAQYKIFYLKGVFDRISQDNKKILSILRHLKES